MKIRGPFFSGKGRQNWLPFKLSFRAFILVLVLVSLANPSKSFDPCDSDLSVSTLDDFYIRVLHLTGTSVRITWHIPKLVQKSYPDYYCIVYNSKHVQAGYNCEFELKNLTTDIFYEINVKPCVNGICYAKSKTFRVHT